MATDEDISNSLRNQGQRLDEEEDIYDGCNICYNLKDFEFSPLHNAWKATPIALFKSAAQGCHSCGILLGALERYMNWEEEADAELKLQCELIGYLRFCTSGQYIKIRSSSMDFDIQVYTTDGKARSPETLHFREKNWLWSTDITARVTQRWPLISLASHVSGDSSSAECFAQAKTWMEECFQEHGKQNCLPRANARLPTRVIDVGSSTRQPRVHESAPDQTGTWAALSYRWGPEGRQNLMLTSSSLARLTKGFDAELLPKTCRDAIMAARGLDIQYLWIDSLCILQDSREDWERESAVMRHVYRNALVTIAAIDSASAETGLFRPLPEREYRKIDRKWLADAPSDEIFARPTQFYNWGDTFRHGTDPEQRMVPDSLNTRAWTFQETLLSPRILWFTAYELIWTCCSGMACECSSSMKKSSLITNRASETSSREPIFNLHLRTKFSYPEKTDWSSQWLILVDAFTRRALTFPTDRLPALSGVASLLAEYVEGSYYAGMWKVRLVDQLMWTATRHPLFESANLAETIHKDYAPSWSWASVGRGAEISQFLPHPSQRSDMPLIWQCEVQGTSFQPSQSNIYGPGRGKILIESKRLALTFHEARRIHMTHYHYGIKRECSTHLDFRPKDSRLESFGSSEVTFDPRDYFRWDLDKVETNADVFFIGIHVFQQPNGGETFERMPITRKCYGLACVGAGDAGTFRRVGYCHFDLGGDESWDAWQSIETTTICLV